MNGDIPAHCTKDEKIITDLRTKLADAEKALGFYADKANYENYRVTTSGVCNKVADDFGHTAQQYFSESRNPKQ